MGDGKNLKKILNGKFHNTKPVGKPRTRWQTDGLITDPRIKRMEETSRRQRRMEESSEGCQGPQSTDG
jgi:hypothetical protein